MTTSQKSSILLVYTGGTIGMKVDPALQALTPFDFSQILEEVPELRKFAYRIDSWTFDPLIDSSDVEPSLWISLAELIEEKYDEYDGFVILHGTDTMAYSASALSFMIENLSKPVIFTGSQLPIGMPRTDGKENLISAVEIAAAKDADGHALVPEVCICFDNILMRGNRT
jgi:L-asparaginase